MSRLSNVLVCMGRGKKDESWTFPKTRRAANRPWMENGDAKYCKRHLRQNVWSHIIETCLNLLCLLNVRYLYWVCDQKWKDSLTNLVVWDHIEQYCPQTSCSEVSMYSYGFIIKPNRITSPLPVCFNFMWKNTLCSEKGHVYSKFSHIPGIHDMELHGYLWCFLLYCQDLYIVFVIGPDVEVVLWPVTSVLYNFLKFIQLLIAINDYYYWKSMNIIVHMNVNGDCVLY